MDLLINGHEYKYETEKVIRLFFPNEKIVFLYNCETKSDRYILTRVFENSVFVEAEINGCSFSQKSTINDQSNKTELIIASLIFNILKKVTGKNPGWGIMTGIRPTKLYRSLKNKFDADHALSVLKNDYYISDDKFSLCKNVSDIEEGIINRSVPESYSLYVSIPFCPTRCRYCSFVSHSIEKTAKLIPEYLEKIKEELVITSNIARGLNLKLETVYIGGGTPTVLSSEQLQTLLVCIDENFDLTRVKEFTVEAGRPDTVTKGKLEVLKAFNVSRISINPQTFNDLTLERIGRGHTSNQTTEAFLLAREVGFDNINMDLIAGLEGETLKEFSNSIDNVIKLSPESVTVHTLSLKSASYLAEDGSKLSYSVKNQVPYMLNKAYETLYEKGYSPYYMYRQSKTIDNLENTGWCLEGKECLYNVYMMDETHTVLAVGGGAVTKLKQPMGEYIERIFNFKFPYEYINRFDELIERKRGIKEFYDRYK